MMLRFLRFYAKAVAIVTTVLIGGIGLIRGIVWLVNTYPVTTKIAPFVIFIAIVSFFVAGVLDVRDADRETGR